MAGVQRPPIRADIRTKSVHLGEPLAGIMTALAEAHERAEPKFVHVAMMRLDVIADCRRLDEAALKAEFAQRVFE
jgi:hypothetical protein